MDLPAPWDVKEGQEDPCFKKIVKDVIFVTADFVVYLDEKNYTYWWCTHDYDSKLPAGFGAVLNRLSELEAIPIETLSADRQVAFRILVAEGLARALDERDVASANAAHDKALEYVRERLKEVARSWHLGVAIRGVIVTGSAMVALGLLARAGTVGWPNALLFLEITGGALGAAFSLLTRIGKLDLDPAAGKALNQGEAYGRLLAGAVGAYLVNLAISSGLVFPNLATGNSAALLLMCIVSGISERLVPNVIAKIDGNTNEQPKALAVAGGPSRGTPDGSNAVPSSGKVSGPPGASGPAVTTR
jgi:hypothetical protein